MLLNPSDSRATVRPAGHDNIERVGVEDEDGGEEENRESGDTGNTEVEDDDD